MNAANHLHKFDQCGDSIMSNTIKKSGLILIGVIAGVMLSLNFSAIANKENIEAIHPLPIEELRTFAQVFGQIGRAHV